MYAIRSYYGNRKPGDWGGVIIIGNGIINRTGSPILTEGPEAEDYSGGTVITSYSIHYTKLYDFCEGMAEELINALLKIEELHVASRTSAFGFKGRDQDVQSIGRQRNNFV